MIKPLEMPEMRKCKRCGAEFKPYRPHQVYCSPVHYQLDYNEQHDIAGKLREIRRKRKKEEELKKIHPTEDPTYRKPDKLAPRKTSYAINVGKRGIKKKRKKD